jgi:hypothetical protein
MISMRTLLIAAAGLIFSASGHAAAPVDPSADRTAASEAAGAMNMGDSDAAMARMDEHINRMHEMHTRMSAAKTPAERSALMAERMKTMQDGMDLMRGMMAQDKMPAMKGMRGRGNAGDGEAPMPAEMAMHRSMMQKHMQMMHSMMQLMIDAMPQPSS